MGALNRSVREKISRDLSREHTRINGDCLIIRDLFWTSYINPVLILIATYFGHEQIDHLCECVRDLNKTRLN